MVRIANWLQPLLAFFNPMFRRSADGARDVIEYAMDPRYAGQDGYFIMNKRAQSSEASRNEKMQGMLWNKSLEWAGISQKDTVLPL